MRRREPASHLAGRRLGQLARVADAEIALAGTSSACAEGPFSAEERTATLQVVRVSPPPRPLRTKEAFGREGATMHPDRDLYASRLQGNMER
jgi:hypothetical protein